VLLQLSLHTSIWLQFGTTMSVVRFHRTMAQCQLHGTAGTRVAATPLCHHQHHHPCWSTAQLCGTCKSTLNPHAFLL